MGLCIKKHDLDADCISCGNCLKSCPNGSPRIQLRSPVNGFLSNVKMSQAEAAFTSSFIGLSISLSLIKDYIREINLTFGAEVALWDEFLVIMLFSGLSLVLFYFFSYIIKPITRQSQKHNFRFFGFFLIPYVFFVLFDMTSVHEVLQNGMTLYYNVLTGMGVSLHGPRINHLLGLQGIHFIQGLGIVAGCIMSIVFCVNELQKALNDRQRNKIISVFSLYLVAITGYSLYLLLFL